MSTRDCIPVFLNTSSPFRLSTLFCCSDKCSNKGALGSFCKKNQKIKIIFCFYSIHESNNHFMSFLSLCVVPKNIYNSPTERIFVSDSLPDPSGNFHSSSYISLILFGLQKPSLTPRKFQLFLWGGGGLG